ncbi:hypothetical protein LX36DRAFT_123244 [Colletotrichum falcatum]|nr:hypothetical protein LX36DRAFT_123244 [Colletotrichum falcatum]
MERPRRIIQKSRACRPRPSQQQGARHHHQRLRETCRRGLTKKREPGGKEVGGTLGAVDGGRRVVASRTRLSRQRHVFSAGSCLIACRFH